MSTTSHPIEVALQLLEQVQAAQDDEVRGDKLTKLIELTGELRRMSPSEATVHHLDALAWYEMASSVERDARIQQSASAALELDPDDQFVMALLAYHAFDREQWAEAQQWLSRLSTPFFSGLDQYWRNLKHAELSACCLLRLGQYRAGVAGVDAVVKDYLNAAEEDRPLPIEIARTVAGLGDVEEAAPYLEGLRLAVRDLATELEITHLPGFRQGRSS